MSLLSWPAAWRWAAALAGGGILASAFPPWQSTEAAWFGFIPLLVAARFSSPAQSFRIGFTGGFVFWLATLSWLLSMANTGGPLPLVVLAWVALSAYCSLYHAAFLALVSVTWHGWVWSRTSPPLNAEAPKANPDGLGLNLGRVLLFPAAWVGFEYLRSTLFTGFGWNALGVSQYANLAVIQSAEWGGVYSVSAICMVMNASLALTAISLGLRYTDRFRKTRVHLELMAGLLICAGAWVWGHREVVNLNGDSGMESHSLRVALVQGNIEQGDKWTEASEAELRSLMCDLTRKALISKPDLVVWPETAVQEARADAAVNAMLVGLTTDEARLLTGSLEFYSRGTYPKLHNAALLFGPEGLFAESYNKVHLVPFGEYIPFENVVPPLAGLSPIGYSCKPGTSNTVFRLDQGRVPFSVLICFEDTIAPLARRSVLNGARLLINLTNDAWFEGSAAAWQHAAHCVFRSVENRVPAVRCANMGLSCFISETGAMDFTTREWIKKRSADLADYRVDEVRLRKEPLPATFYTRYGDAPFALPCGVLSGLSFAWLLWRRRQERLSIEQGNTVSQTD